MVEDYRRYANIIPITTNANYVSKQTNPVVPFWLVIMKRSIIFICRSDQAEEY